MSKPGVVLRRPVGSDGPFREHADLPTDLADGGLKHKPKKTLTKPKEQVPRATDDTRSCALVGRRKRTSWKRLYDARQNRAKQACSWRFLSRASRAASIVATLLWCSLSLFSNAACALAIAWLRRWRSLFLAASSFQSWFSRRRCSLSNAVILDLQAAAWLCMA